MKILDLHFLFDPETDDLIGDPSQFWIRINEYMFLLLNSSDNRIVSSAPDNPTFFHAGTFINMELDMTDDISLPSARRHEFSDINELYEHVSNMDYNKYQGIIVFAPNNLQYKIFNRGNIMNYIKFSNTLTFWCTWFSYVLLTIPPIP
jgi:hypothetical protein